MQSNIKDFFKTQGLDLTDDEIDKHYIDWKQIKRGMEACAECKGISECKATMPGLKPVWEYNSEQKHLSLAYGFCSESVKAQGQARREKLLNSSRLPALLKQKTFDNFRFSAENKAAYDDVFALVEDFTSWITLAGTTGTGKTHLAAALLNKRLEQGREAVFVTVPELLDDIRQSMKKDASSELIELVINVDFLILDDFGAERTNDWVMERLFVIINSRLLHQKQTVITTNYVNPSDLITKLNGLPGQRIVSRLSEAGSWVRMVGKDYRLVKKASVERVG